MFSATSPVLGPATPLASECVETGPDCCRTVMRDGNVLCSVSQPLRLDGSRHRALMQPTMHQHRAPRTSKVRDSQSIQLTPQECQTSQIGSSLFAVPEMVGSSTCTVKHTWKEMDNRLTGLLIVLHFCCISVLVCHCHCISLSGRFGCLLEELWHQLTRALRSYNFEPLLTLLTLFPPHTRHLQNFESYARLANCLRKFHRN